ncbi:unnamed protein product [Zymoseptoria tritici ST99CH_1A5]|uniref:Ferric reductase NAD binding domain-containing protein n=1 Tax=Zymoseptoria tritici ST99CH_1A5 TaxID=1276529 RepID=A0A1Y6M2X5_ZYMTR|nr:unnamed protein product [Zymoseptoria tritici ST99CH_1A5]
MFASGDGIFAQLPFIKSLTEDSKRAAIKTRRIKLVWQTEEYHGQLQQWMQSILDDEEVSLELLDISIHIPAEADESNLSKVVEVADSKVRKIGNRLKVIRDIPDVESYVQLEMKEPRRDVAVTVSGFEKLREEVRSQVLATGRLNVQLFELDFQPQRVFQHRGGTAA